MKIVNQKIKVKCDICSCKNFADISIVPDNCSPKDYINLCNDCAKAMYENLAKLVVPKAIKNPILGVCYSKKGGKNAK